MAAIGWGISGLGYVVGPRLAWSLLDDLAGTRLPPHPMLSYWLSMAALTFAFVGVLFGLCLWRSFRNLAPILATFQLILAGLLTAYSWRWGFVATIQVYDAAFLALTGLYMLVGWRAR